MAFSDTFKLRVKNSYLTGDHTSLNALCKAHRIKSLSTLKRWIEEGQWARDKEEVYRKAEEKVVEEATDKIAARNAEHDDAWSLIMSHAMNLLRDKDGKPKVGIKAAELECVSRTVERVQKGQRMALGIKDDMPEDRRVVVEFKPLRDQIKAQNNGNGVDFEESPGVDVTPALAK